MSYFVGLDASKRTTKICVIDEAGAIVREGVVASDPKAIVGFLRGEGWRYKRVGLEAWALASWLYVGLARAGLPVICIEAMHAHSILASKRPNKTDRNDARGIAEIMRAGLYKPVHIKSLESQRIKAALTARKALRNKSVDIDNCIAATLLVFGVKLKRGGRLTTFEGRVRRAAVRDKVLLGLIEPLLAARKVLVEQMGAIERALVVIADEDPVCRRLMTAPGVGLITALIFRSAVDEPGRFTRSRDVAAHFGLTPAARQSGETDLGRRISKRGDGIVRQALVTAAISQFRAVTRTSWLKEWAMQVATRRGRMKAMVATARRLAVVLHRMWVTETDFRWALASA